jgi:hypothetical protein
METGHLRPGLERDLGCKMVADVEAALRRNAALLEYAGIPKERIANIVLSLLADMLAMLAVHTGDASAGRNYLEAAIGTEDAQNRTGRARPPRPVDSPRR